MVTEETIRLFTPAPYKTVVGWIFPDGSIVQCDLYKHLEVLPEKYKERYKELVEDYEERMYRDLDDLGPDEHPAMHRFDPTGDSMHDVVRELTIDGYMRLGVHKNRANEISVEVSGNNDVLRLHHTTIGMLAAGLGCTDVGFVDITRGYKRKRLKEFSK